MLRGFATKFAASVSVLFVAIAGTTLSAGQQDGDPITGGFGVSLGANIETALAVGYLRLQYPDGGVYYGKRQPDKFFRELKVTATMITGTITSVEAIHRYNKEAEIECRNDMNVILDELNNRYSSLERQSEKPMIAVGLEDVSYHYLIYRDGASNARGRSISLVCGRIEGKSILAMQYKTGPKEFNSLGELLQFQREQEKIDRREAASKLKARGIDPEDF